MIENFILNYLTIPGSTIEIKSIQSKSIEPIIQSATVATTTTTANPIAAGKLIPELR